VSVIVSPRRLDHLGLPNFAVHQTLGSRCSPRLVTAASGAAHNHFFLASRPERNRDPRIGHFR